MKKIICIADWAQDPLASQEFKTATEGYSRDPNMVRISFVPSSPSTVHAGFLANQLVETEVRLGRPTETLIYLSTDPRQEAQGAVENSQGSPFVIARLVSDIYVCGHNSGYAFSFLKSQIEELFTYPGIESVGQFNARDNYSRVVAHLADYLEEEMQLEETHINSILDVERNVYFVGHVDAFGNIKTTMTRDDLKGKKEFGEVVQVTIGSVTQEARFTEKMYDDAPGAILVHPGSSGSPENPYLEISVWQSFEKGERHTTFHEFQNPRPGDIVKII